MIKFVLKLYITGQTPRSEQAIVNLQQICQAKLQDRYELIIIDVLKCPQLAEAEKIIATPTLIREKPPPLRRLCHFSLKMRLGRRDFKHLSLIS